MVPQRSFRHRLATPPPARYRRPAGRRPAARGGLLRCGIHRHEARLSDAPHQADLILLLRRCGDGDRGAFRQLYDRQAARLHGIALRITRQPSLAADAVHDAFLSVWQNAGSFDPDRGAPEAWLTSIVRYRALDMARRRTRETTVAEMPEQADEDPDPLARLVGSSEAIALRRCLEQLDAEKRRLVVLAFMDGLSHSELSEQLAMPLGTVKSSIRRSLAGLKRCLEP